MKFRLSNTKSLFFTLILLFMFDSIYAANTIVSNITVWNSAFVFFVLLLIFVVNNVLGNAIKVLSERATHEGTDSETNALIHDIKEKKAVFFYLMLLFLTIYVIYISVAGTAYESHAAEWLNLMVRWMHVVFGIAWIGASFYFNFLENSLNRTKGLRDEIAGNLWAVHGGGFYYVEKYKLAPKEIPKDLHWFKYEAYFTWLSGIILLAIVYYFDAKVYLIDPQVLNLSPEKGIAIGVGSLLFGWLIYDTMCKSPLVKKPVFFSVLLILFIAGFAWFFLQVFSARAAYIHLGALIGTMMVGNVFRVIIPSQKAMVSAAKRGLPLDPVIGKNALLRSRHNNYLTLPVIFIMISNHFPSTYGSTFNWIVLIGLSISSVLIKHYLNKMEQGEKAVWIMPIALLLMFALAMVSAPKTKEVCKGDKPAQITEIQDIIGKRCSSCHSANPTDDVIKLAPNGIKFDTPAEIKNFSERIMQRVVITKTMPQANKTNMTQDERDLIQCWIDSGAPVE